MNDTALGHMSGSKGEKGKKKKIIFLAPLTSAHLQRRTRLLILEKWALLQKLLLLLEQCPLLQREFFLPLPLAFLPSILNYS
jgi:hypothetical protein